MPRVRPLVRSQSAIRRPLKSIPGKRRWEELNFTNSALKVALKCAENGVGEKSIKHGAHKSSYLFQLLPPKEKKGDGSFKALYFQVFSGERVNITR